MNEFPWTPQHDRPAAPVQAAEPEPEAMTEEVVPDSGDQADPAPADEEVVVDTPSPKKPAAKKASSKKNVRKGLR